MEISEASLSSDSEFVADFVVLVHFGEFGGGNAARALLDRFAVDMTFEMDDIVFGIDVDVVALIVELSVLDDRFLHAGRNPQCVRRVARILFDPMAEAFALLPSVRDRSDMDLFLLPNFPIRPAI